VKPTTPVLYLRSGDQLHLTCEQRVTLTSVEKDKVSWWKAASWRGVAVDIADDKLRYQQIDTGGANAPYTVNQANVSGDLLRSELVKSDVSAVDSGFYRCRLDLGGEFGRILVTVVDSTSLSSPLSVCFTYQLSKLDFDLHPTLHWAGVTTLCKLGGLA